MIKKITLKNVASYKEASKVEFADSKKRCSFFYGLNGVGKSTLSSYLYFYRKIEEYKRHGGTPGSEIAQIATRYKDCSLEIEPNSEILVYNRDFIKKNFGESRDDLQGIEISVTLGEENNQAETNIRNAEAERLRIQGDLETAEEEKKRIETESKKASDSIKKMVADEIKEKAVFAHLQDKMKSQPAKIWEELLQTGAENPTMSIEEIASRMEQLDENAEPTSPIRVIRLDFASVEQDSIWGKVVTNGNTENEFSNIDGYSEWLNSGLKFLNGSEEDDCTCPFCHSDERKKLRKFVSLLIGEEYKQDKKTIRALIEKYRGYTDMIEHAYEDVPAIVSEEKKRLLEDAVRELRSILSANLELMKQKDLTANKIIELRNTSMLCASIESIIAEINIEIENNNTALSDRKAYVRECLTQFWLNMRVAKADAIRINSDAENTAFAQISAQQTIIENCRLQIDTQNQIIKDNSEKKYDIAYENINHLLESVGIFDFKLELIDGRTGSYKLVRPNAIGEESVYKTLSEGEKTMISFLYFMQVCEGTDSSKDRIVVIDDPISSMSNVFLFNIASLIQREFTIFDNEREKNNLKQKYAQVILLTHNLNFFYEVLDYNKGRSEKFQQLVRIVKDTNGSRFEDLHYDDIQNDYQAYWKQLKEATATNPTIIANCMRNIVERFFGLVEMQEISDVFNDARLNNPKYDALKKFMNNGSHSSITSYTDSREFDHEAMMRSFRDLFNDMGYVEHYDKMII